MSRTVPYWSKLWWRWRFRIWLWCLEGVFRSKTIPGIVPTRVVSKELKKARYLEESRAREVKVMASTRPTVSHRTKATGTAVAAPWIYHATPDKDGLCDIKWPSPQVWSHGERIWPYGWSSYRPSHRSSPPHPAVGAFEPYYYRYAWSNEEAWSRAWEAASDDR